jgi:hypothetical protein
MGNLALLALRTVIVTVVAGSLFVQAVMVPLLAADMEEVGSDLAGVRFPVAVILILGIVTMQVTAVCVWRLLTMVRRDTLFSHAAFGFVNVAIGAIATAAFLALALAITLAPGEAVPAGIVLLICGVAVAIAGIALIVLVLRMLLANAVALDTETHHLQAELAGVI